MSKVTKLKVKQPDGNFSEDIDIGAKAANISLASGSNVETKLGEIDNSINDFTEYKSTTDERLESVEAKISSVYRPMGSVSTYNDLEDKKATAEIGDVWNVLDTGKNYAWTSESEWDDLGGTVNLTNYYTKDQTYNRTEIDKFAKIEKADNEADALSKSQQNPNVLYYWTE